MARLLPTVLVLALLAGTVAAFVVTERLKLVRSPIAARQVTPLFSPICGCAKERAEIAIALRRSDTITVSVVDGGDRVVRTLLRDRRTPASTVEVVWDGRDDAGRVVPEGAYRPRVRLEGARRTIVLPNLMRVDTTPPQVVEWRVQPRVLSPDGDHRRDRVRIAYRFDGEAHAQLLVDGERQVRTRWQRPESRLAWPANRDAGLPARRYELVLRAEDRAGNLSEPTEPAAVHVRYVSLGSDHVTVRPGRRFTLGVASDAERVDWRFAGRRGTSPPGLLVLRAPRRPGRYTLFVVANGHGARARVTVRAG